ncbi:2-phosphosulfolactate phosphatase [Frankia nepalensis]|uniref:Probable 2-phosphosulfolactate phosphatase n=1 Tax=Frankia nepalensis TaxID=1836974 RepID=A0A937RFW2_9ACTN|nr:2-phosphosulfolactate phosphatase [Frankia nepalensis]MBL7498461.1 2-phosphosulfolactate phosphatase [Frankia nepalensis]MBL7509482.1 2-phosphosulfolactate phosphatase [Frankia nepalensis]MBL7629292.1 2-phosphosulfolactate phosphatase [Frankia nepalensis]
MVAGQGPFVVRFGWGGEDLAALAPVSDLVVIVDVLRFTTAVSVAVGCGASVLPYRWRDATAARFAARRGAILAGPRDDPGTPWSLSPTDLAHIPAGTRLVLPSPNGATLSAAASDHGATLVAGCPRNATAVGGLVAREVAAGRSIAVIAAGERWPDASGTSHAGPLRPAVEDLLGAGAVIARAAEAGALARSELSPEARAARAAFDAAAPVLRDELRGCASGRELLALGWDDDVAAAAQLDADTAVPILRDGAFVALDEAA